MHHRLARFAAANGMTYEGWTFGGTVPGPVLRVREGDQVQQGQLMARIQPDFYAAQVEQAQAGVLERKAAQAQRRADMLGAEAELKRQKELKDKGVIAASQYEQAETTYEVAKAAYEAAEFSVRSAEARLRESRESLGKTALYAPMTGTVDTPRNIRRTSAPSMSGRPRSRTTTSGRHSTAAASAPAPVASVRTAWPAATRPRVSDSRIGWSSSITSTDAITPRYVRRAGRARLGRPPRRPACAA